MRRLVILSAAVALVVLLAIACTFQVGENEIGMVMRFGRHHQEVGPGLHFKLPPPIDTVMRIDRRVNVLDPESNEYLTNDKKNVVIDSFLAWRVVDPHKYLVTVGQRVTAEARLKDLSRSALGEVISNHPFSALVSAEPQAFGVAEVGDALTAIADAKAKSDFGIEVLAMRVKRINFPGQNKDAVFNRMDAEREAIAGGIRSEGQEQYEKIKADTDSSEKALLATANKKAAELKGAADAEVLRILTEAYARDPELAEFLRRLDLLDVFTDRSTIILPADHDLLKVLESAPKKTDGAKADEKP